MSKTVLTSFTILCLLSTVFLTRYKISVKASSNVIYVPDDYPTIQEAINNANQRDTVFVRNGTYYENVVVNTTVSLIGENRNTTIIDGNRTGTVIRVVANNVNIGGFTIQKSGYGIRIEPEPTIIWYEGIYIDHACGTNISHNIIASNGYGIRLNYSNGNIITGNNILSNWDGIIVQSSNKNTLMNNSCSNNHKDGIYLYSSNRNDVTVNSCSNE